MTGSVHIGTLHPIPTLCSLISMTCPSSSCTRQVVFCWVTLFLKYKWEGACIVTAYDIEDLLAHFDKIALMTPAITLSNIIALISGEQDIHACQRLSRCNTTYV